METLGDKIKRVRKLLQLSQNEYSNILGISQGTLSDLELNKNKPSLETSIALNKTFQMVQEPLLSLSALNREAIPHSLSDDETKLLVFFRQMNRGSQSELLAYAEFKMKYRQTQIPKTTD